MHAQRLLASVGILIALVLGVGLGPNQARAMATVPDTGVVDFAYHGLITPTGEKPQSKLWYNDGRWWADMLFTDGMHYIFSLDRTTQQWVKTATRLDSRTQTKSDSLWDGTHLYVGSGGGFESTGADLDGVLYRFSYNVTTKTYTRDFGPITIRPGGAETIVIDKDTTGRLWMTSAQQGEIYVSHSLDSDRKWTVPFPIPAAGVNEHIATDDISTLVAFSCHIGVMWSNQVDSTVNFAIHADGDPDTAWTGEVVLHDPNVADDHINLKSIPGDPSGRVFAVIKTSYLGTTAETPRILLLTRQQNGQWNTVMVSSAADHQTRPILLLDASQQQLSIISADESGGAIYIKQSGLNNPQFMPGKGIPFISNAIYNLLDDPTSTKQPITAASGIVVMASEEPHTRYLHNTLLGVQAPPPAKQIYLPALRR